MFELHVVNIDGKYATGIAGLRGLLGEENGRSGN